jgi:uroporphyrinogen-III synthase
MDTPDLGDRVVALLEARRSQELATLVERHGGRPRVVPAMREVEADAGAALRTLAESVTRDGLHLAVFQTGVGAAGLLRQLAELGPEAERPILDAIQQATVVVRGPKPTAVLRTAGIHIDLSGASPFTTTEVLALLESLELAGRRVLVQHHGGPNEPLLRYLAERGAVVLEAVLYRWALPEDTRPVFQLMDELGAGAIDAVLFTSASQVHNLLALAEGAGRAGELRRSLAENTVVTAVGPVCAAALEEHDIRPVGGIVQPENPKMVPMVQALREHFAHSAT